jgi:hypothetical protein
MKPRHEVDRNDIANGLPGVEQQANGGQHHDNSKTVLENNRGDRRGGQPSALRRTGAGGSQERGYVERRH